MEKKMLFIYYRSLFLVFDLDIEAKQATLSNQTLANDFVPVFVVDLFKVIRDNISVFFYL